MNTPRATALTLVALALASPCRARERSTPDAAPASRSLLYLELWLDRSLREPLNDSRASTTSVNPTDEDSLSYLHGDAGVRLGYSYLVLPPLTIGPRLGYGRIMAVQGGPSVHGLDAGVTAAVHLLRPRGKRGTGLSVGLALASTIPTAVTGPDAQRAVQHSVRAHLGWSAAAEVHAFWHLGRSVLIAGLSLTSRCTPYTWSSTLASDPTTSHRADHGGQHALVGVSAGYGWAF